MSFLLIIKIYSLIFFYSLPEQTPLHFTRKLVILVVKLGHECCCYYSIATFGVLPGMASSLKAVIKNDTFSK